MSLEKQYTNPCGEGCLFVELGMMFGPLLYTNVVDAIIVTHGWNYLLSQGA